MSLLPLLIRKVCGAMPCQLSWGVDALRRVRAKGAGAVYAWAGVGEHIGFATNMAVLLVPYGKYKDRFQ